MKTIFVSLCLLLATPLLSSLSAAPATFPAPLAEHQICISILFVTYCYTWDVSAPAGKPAQHSSTVRATFSGDERLVLTGFSREMEGAVFLFRQNEPLAGDRCANLSSSYAIQAGKYRVRKGALTLPLTKAKSR